MRRVLVTGATGYLGGAVVREFVSAGWHVRCLVRATSELAGLPPEVEKATGDVTEAASLRTPMRGVDLVCHLAALVASRVRDQGLFGRVNVGGLANVLSAARELSVPRVLYTSSFLALGPTDDVELADESHVPAHRHFHTDYERTKSLALTRLGEFVAQGVPVVTVVPGALFGPGRKTEGSLLNSFIDQAARGELGPLVGSGEQRWSFAYVPDVARGHVLAAQRGRPGERYILGGENLSLAEFFALTAELAGRPFKLRTVPLWLAQLGSLPGLVRARLGGRPPELTPGGLASFVHSWALSSDKASRELGYRVRPLRTALQETLSWLKDVGTGPG